MNNINISIHNRKLVTIRQVKDIIPIKGADLIETLVIDGWQCVGKKGEFSKGDLAIYFEIDSFLPLEPEFNFLEKCCKKKMGDTYGLRLKTQKFKGAISQGLALPYSKLKRYFEENPFNANCDTRMSLNNSDDLAPLMGVIKYEPPIPAQLSGDLNGIFPNFIRKTDEERIQNLWDTYSKNLSSDSEFTATIKLDGTSMTCFVIDTNKYTTNHIDKLEVKPNYYFGVCSRNFELKESSINSYWNVANTKIKDKFLDYCIKNKRNLAIQGELMGEGIQNNREKLKGHNFYCYKIWDIDKQQYVSNKERIDIIQELNIDGVPIISKSIKPFKEFSSIEQILDFAEGESINNPIREGVVFTSNTINDENISFKVISNKFLLKGGN
jgi:RNA ligase (TIGR02306 family)